MQFLKTLTTFFFVRTALIDVFEKADRLKNVQQEENFDKEEEIFTSPDLGPEDFASIDGYALI